MCCFRVPKNVKLIVAQDMDLAEEYKQGQSLLNN